MRIIQRSQVWAIEWQWTKLRREQSSIILAECWAGLGRNINSHHISRWLTLQILDRALKPENITKCLHICLVLFSRLGVWEWIERSTISGIPALAILVSVLCYRVLIRTRTSPLHAVSTWDSLQQHQQLHLNCILVYSMRWAALQRHSDSMPHSQSQPDRAASLEVAIVLTGMRLESSM